MKKLLEKLKITKKNEDQRNFRNVYISGMGGSGKSVLARELIKKAMSSEKDIIHFDFHGECQFFKHELGVTELKLEKTLYEEEEIFLPFHNIMHNTEYLGLYLQITCGYVFKEGEHEFFLEHVPDFLEKQGTKSITLKPLMDYLRKKGSLGTKIAYQMFLFKNKEVLSVNLEERAPYRCLDFGHYHRLYRILAPYLFCEIIAHYQKTKKECWIVIEEYGQFGDTLIHDIVKEIVRNNAYPNIKLLICDGIRYMTGEDPMITDYDTVYLYRQGYVNVEPLRLCFGLSRSQMNDLANLSRGEVLKIRHGKKKFERVEKTILSDTEILTLLSED